MLLLYIFICCSVFLSTIFVKIIIEYWRVPIQMLFFNLTSFGRNVHKGNLMYVYIIYLVLQISIIVLRIDIMAERPVVEL